MIAALSGRRVDAADATVERLPLTNIELVAERIREVLASLPASALVCSAACGADLLALEVAGRLGIRRRIILPFEPEVFRLTSVVDRPGGWGDRYDRILKDVARAQDLVVLGLDQHDAAPYMTAAKAILDQAAELGQAEDHEVAAIVVWDGRSRRAGDVTEAFLSDARARRLAVTEVSTLK